MVVGGSSFVGRTRELEVLLEAVGEAAEGRSNLVFVIGEAGIGKSALVDALTARALSRDFAVLHGAAEERDLTAFSLWAGPAAQLGLGSLGEEFLDAAERRWEALGLVADAMSRRSPALVIIEDLHWADEQSKWLLGRLTGSLAGRGVMLLATSRDDDALVSSRPSSVVRLRGLDVADVSLLVERARTRGGAAGVNAEALHAQTGGNPLFIRELLDGPGSAGDLPPLVGTVLGQGLRRLDDGTRRVLTALALSGADVPLPVLAKALASSVGDIRTCLDRAVRAEVLVGEANGRMRFRHALLGSAVVELVEPDELRLLHRELAASWSALEPSELGAMRNATHLLAAVPIVPAADAVGAATHAGRVALTAGDPVVADRLFGDALKVLTAYTSHEPGLRAEVLVEVAATRHQLGDAPGASAAAEDAAALAVRHSDPVVRGRAELAAARYLPLFADDPDRRRRIREAEHALPLGDDAVRVGLLGRLGIMGMTRRDSVDEGQRLSDEAVAMARRLHDPALVAGALIDRFISLRSGQDIELRRAAADELVEMGERARRPDLVLTGHEWQYSARLHVGDLAGARIVLDHMDALASVLPSPFWRYAVLLRRSMISAIDGEHSVALDLAAEASPIGRAILFEGEAAGLEAGLRCLIARLTGLEDRTFPAICEQAWSTSAKIQVPFIQLHLAAMALQVGDREAAHRIVTRWAPEVADITACAPPAVVATLGTLVAELGLTQYVPRLRDLLGQFGDCWSLETGFALDLPVDVTLGRLAMLDGDAAGGVLHGMRALAVARRTGSGVLEAHSLWWLGEAQRAAGAGQSADESQRAARAIGRHTKIDIEASQRPTSRSPAGAETLRASLERTPAGWHIASPHGSGDVAHSVGLGQLAQLLAAAPAEVSSLHLAGHPASAPAGDLGGALDTTAKRAYRYRITELRAEIEDADDCADLERASRARLEFDALISELQRAVGLGGRDRPNGSTAERARINVARSLRRGIRSIRKEVPDLGAHLDVSVQTGQACRYAPEPSAALRWKVSP